MFGVEVRDHVMIAHSLPAPVFGPAQGMHGATYTVDAAFLVRELDADNLVVDIGRATDELKAVLDPLRYANLDVTDPFVGRITTTEFLCRHIFDALASAVLAGRLGDGGRIQAIRVTLSESHLARAWYEGELTR